MTPELEARLYSRWPEIFGGRKLPITQSLMPFGLECGDGWYSLVDALCETLTEHSFALERRPPEAIQAKEKYGTFRFYVRGEDEFDDGAITMAEMLSGCICEVTGSPGLECHKGGWYATRSPDIAAREGWRTLPDMLGQPIRVIAPMATSDAAARLKADWPEVMLCDPDIPPGWIGIADVLASCLEEELNRGDATPSRILALGQADGELVVRIDAVRDRDLGAAAMAVAMSRRTDPMTGSSWQMP